MHAFTDSKGRVWEISINGYWWQVVRDRLGINLLSVFDDDFKIMTDIRGDFAKAMKLAFCLCGEQAEKLKVDFRDFSEGFNRDVAQAMCHALEEEMVFFSDDAENQTLRKWVEAARTLQSLIAKSAAKAAVMINPSELMNGLSAPSGDAPVSAASTPTDSP